MKNIIRYLFAGLLILSFFLIHSCKKDKATPPVLTTIAPFDITQTTAASGGIITNDGGNTITSRGVCWNTVQDPTIFNSKTNEGGGSGTFTSFLSSLLPNTQYYARAYATTIAGFGYGNQVSFNTSQISQANLETTGLISVALTSAIAKGFIMSDNGGPVTSKGFCWSITNNPTTSNSKTDEGAGTGLFTSSISGLQSETVYHVRAYAINSAGTSYGNEVSFKTYSGTVTDIDANTYFTISIGTQVWMAENLRVTKFRNGDPVPDSPISVSWDTVTTPASCVNPFFTNYASIYGRQYNWFAVSDIRNICPTGWHVSTDAEWSTLTDYLGGESIAGEKMKESGTAHWNNSSADVTNESGFTGRPGAFRSLYGGIAVMPGDEGSWWTATEFDATGAWNCWLSSNDVSVSRTSNSKKAGFSVRCVKD